MYQIGSLKDKIEFFRSALEEGRPFMPLSVKIKLTWNCNLSCVMCNSIRQARGTELTYKRVINLIQELSSLGCRKIHFSGGEPLLWDGLFDAAEYGRLKKHIKINLTTNGTLITPEVAKRLIRAKFKTVSISLDSSDKTIHDKIRGEGSWRRTIEGVRNLVSERDRRESNTKVRFNIVVSKLNYRTLWKVPSLADDLGVDFLMFIPVDDHLELNLKLNYEELVEYNTNIAPLVYEEGKKYNLWEWDEQPFPFGKTFSDIELSSRGLYSRGVYEKIPCFAPWLHSFISPRGRVFVCCMTKDVGVLGKIKNRNFREIWEGELYGIIRKKMLKDRFAECYKCDSFLRENLQIARYLIRE